MGISARIVKRIITLLIVILGVVTLSFCLQIFTGTDPAEMLVRKTTLFATEEQIQAMRVELGLDGTLSEQYADYIKGLLTGDLGISITNRKPVIDNIRNALPVTCIDVKTVEPEVLLKNYAIVFQNVTLFDESVMENIRLGRSGASDEDVRAAAKAAQCDEFIDRLPQGYDTNIGENGSKLSGGERQRISIARALLKNAPVILLDEATASMDAESETMVQTALSALLKGRTVIVIAHRMRTIANADKIVVLDKGKVTEVGTPSELAKKGGLYAHLVALQQKQQMSSLPT